MLYGDVRLHQADLEPRRVRDERIDWRMRTRPENQRGPERRAAAMTRQCAPRAAIEPRS